MVTQVFDLRIPQFCEHYEPLLVEEITLERHPCKIHYGRCAVIGYLRENSNSLDSVMIPSLPETLQLADGTSQLRLSFDHFYGPIPRNCTVRVYGCIRLQGSSDSSMNNSKDLICFLRQLREKSGPNVETAMKEAIDTISRAYIPVLEVNGCEQIQQARELITCNLRLKRINKLLGPRLKET